MSVEINLHPEANDQLSKRTRTERKHLFINQLGRLEWRDDLPLHDVLGEKKHPVRRLQDVGLARSAGLFRTGHLNLAPGTAADGADDWAAKSVKALEEERESQSLKPQVLVFEVFRAGIEEQLPRLSGKLGEMRVENPAILILLVPNPRKAYREEEAGCVELRDMSFYDMDSAVLPQRLHKLACLGDKMTMHGSNKRFEPSSHWQCNGSNWNAAVAVVPWNNARAVGPFVPDAPRGEPAVAGQDLSELGTAAKEGVEGG
ncbi:hypothetical protein B0H14DRAFT_2609743 [Mycena olivaceomarginata]|nr:hypothetical protein B0H14DRAFT_2609743 [Mycena olivaceomarginata]